ncbi:hypothetical protein PG996_007000 [Apiospora saccharicola]|uniref:RRM domain-containing protein n=1 Tax=Apiospora saccharicola TaxID=335842 RepID=A0ABR1V9L2_9PEZI
MTSADDPFGTYTQSAYGFDHAGARLVHAHRDANNSESHLRNTREVTQRDGRQHENRRGRYDDSGVDAQVFYPASSCVFVANLPESMENEKLRTEIDGRFGRFGTCFVKIRRDKKNMPFAFVQFTNDRDATKARNQGAGIVFQGRPCRTEAVRANRTFILRNYVGGTVSEDEAREVLGKYGPILRLEEISQDVAQSHGIDQGILVEFKNFDPDRDIQASFRYHAVYRVVSHEVQRGRRMHRNIEPDHSYMETRAELDSRSIFIGNLPDDLDSLDREVRNLAGEIGHVVNVQIIRKEGRSGYGMNVFAFIEYARPEVAEIAAAELSGRRIAGCRIRVELKETREPAGNDRNPRRVIRHTTPEHRSIRQAPSLYTPRRVENAGSEVTTNMPPTAVTVNPVVSPYPAWHPYGSPSYTTAPFIPAGMDGILPPHPHYLPPSMAWAAPYMSDPHLAPQAYWAALNHAYGTPLSVPSRAARGSGSNGSGGRENSSSENV